jgi:hypothetical protein
MYEHLLDTAARQHQTVVTAGRGGRYWKVSVAARRVVSISFLTTDRRNTKRATEMPGH